MSIYLALLDENPADRKQAERLLYRESSYRAEQGEALYFDTYGKEDAFFPFMEKYDLVFLDVYSRRDGMMIALDMMKKGCSYPVFLCSGELDYKAKYEGDPRFDFDNLYYLDKPLKETDYRQAIDLCLKYKAELKKKVELHGDTETIYVLPEEIIYFREQSGMISISLTGGRNFRSFGRLNDLIASLPSDTSGFMQISKNTVINMREVVSVSGNSFKMSNGAFVKFFILSKPGIVKAWKEWCSQHP
ncbi:MAG: LytTR family transcriptional regulator DNA-binding domain-containing protein [Lachnospiraceae bacterium]|nr:LytTR family transcriptional regulator DNA-binding domain-containing protein [Lachnospiraceae bacterium]